MVVNETKVKEIERERERERERGDMVNGNEVKTRFCFKKMLTELELSLFTKMARPLGQSIASSVGLGKSRDQPDATERERKKEQERVQKDEGGKR